MMTPLEAARRLLYLLRRDQLTAELEEEMRLHRELRAERLQGGGMSPDGARYAAKRRFGNSTHIQERSRDMWGFDWVEQAAADLRFAVRRLRNRPAFSLSTIAVAALGIGATTAVFSVVDAAILRPLPFLRPNELVTLPGVNIPFDPGPQGRRYPPSASIYINDVAGMRGEFASVAAFAAGGLNLEDPIQPRRLKVGVVTAGFFNTLGVNPVRGRAFAPDEGKPGGRKTVVISDGLWATQFNRAPDVLGQSIRLHGDRYEVIGIMPRSFAFPSESEAWIPMTIPTTFETFQSFRGYLPSRVVARVARGMTPGVASQRMLARWELLVPSKVAGQRNSIEDLIDNARAKGAAIPLQRELVGDRRAAFKILMGATLLLLLIACANVANLLLSDGASRRREVALREVLGASRGRVVRQLLVESVVLAFTGAVVGLALAPATLGLMRALMPDNLLGSAPIHVDLRVLVFATLLAIVTGLVFGLWPALGTSKVDAGEAIKSGGGHGATRGKIGATRRLLITAELALTVMLLVGSGLMLKSFYRLMSQEFGMVPANAGTLEMTVSQPGVAELSVPGLAEYRLRVVQTILERLSREPGITAVGAVNDLPLRGGGGIGISITADGMPKPKKSAFPRYLIADGGYFKAMGIALLRGRAFEPTDDTVGQRAAIISRAMAKVYWPDMNPLGRTFIFAGDTTVHYAVIGVVADVREGKLDTDPGPQMYFSMHERGLANLALVARGTLPPGQLLARLTSAVRQAAPTQAVYNVRMMDDVVGKSVAPRRTNTMLIAVFGLLALVLSAFGVYAVVSYSVAQRAREFGIRAALGANRTDIIALVGKDMAVMVAIGLAIGLGGAWGVSRVIESMLYGVTTRDPAIFLTVPIVLIIPAAIATLVPAIRAMRVSPTEVMRAE